MNPNLEHLVRLQELYLGDTQITEAGMAKLRQALPNTRVGWFGLP